MILKSSTKKRITQKDLDAAAFGDEVDFTDPNTSLPTSKSERNVILANAFRLYANTFDSKKDQVFIKKWIKTQTYFDVPKNLIPSIRWTFFSSTFYGLMRLESRGWILSQSETKQIKEYLWSISSVGEANTSNTSNTSPTNPTSNTPLKPKITVFDRVKSKVDNQFLNELEGVLDLWVKNPSASIPDNLNFSSLLSLNEIPLKGAGYNLITSWITNKIQEYDEVAKADDKSELFLEGYFPNTKTTSARRKAITKIISNLYDLQTTLNKTKDKLLAFQDKKQPATSNNKKPSPDLGEFQDNPTTTTTQATTKSTTQSTTQSTTKRINNTKRGPTAAKQVENLKYLKHTDEFGGISSIENPEKLIGKSVVFLFNVKYKKLTCLFSKEGFTVSGTTIKGYDKETSFSQTLRKPQEALEVVKSQSKTQIKKYLKNELTTKQDFQTVTGRCQSDTTIIIRTL